MMEFNKFTSMAKYVLYLHLGIVNFYLKLQIIVKILYNFLFRLNCNNFVTTTRINNSGPRLIIPCFDSN